LGRKKAGAPPGAAPSEKPLNIGEARRRRAGLKGA